MSVDILLATHNGARHLQAQLDSLSAQTVPEWHLLARDDQSTDDTPHMLQNFAARHADRVTLLDSGTERLGAAGNFAALLAASSEPYAMFCAQDGVWYPDKIKRSLVAAQALEGMDESHVPVLVHTDARVVDDAMQPVAPSFHRLRKLHPERAGFSRLLVQNPVLGSTVLVNRALAKLALPVPGEAHTHGHWTVLLASACGLIGCIETPMLDYRQHAGAHGKSLENLRSSVQQDMRHNFAQAEALYARRAPLPPEAADTLNRFIRIGRLPQALRGPALILGGFLRRPWHQNIAVFYFA